MKKKCWKNEGEIWNDKEEMINEGRSAKRIKKKC